MLNNNFRMVDELIDKADMAVRVASQLRLWHARKSIADQDALTAGISFLQEGISGGRFLHSGESTSGFSSLYPLSWSTDAQIGESGYLSEADPSINYEQLAKDFEEVKTTLENLLAGTNTEELKVYSASVFFQKLGRQLGNKADSVLVSQKDDSIFMNEHAYYESGNF